MASTVIPDLYIKRSDAYLKNGNWRRAAIEFRRAANGFPAYADAIDRWREIGPSNGGVQYIDMKTYNDVRKDSIVFWTKEGREADGPYSLVQFELNCSARKIRQLSLHRYDGSGALIASRESGPWWPWQSIIPDTVGEIYYSGACRVN